jgi:hypothetical protein
VGGSSAGIPPTGRSFSCRTAAFFLFEEDRLVCERVDFDATTILSQLGLIEPAPSLRDDAQDEGSAT